MKRDKIVAVCFAVAIILIPVATMIKNSIPTAADTARLEQQTAVLEGNGTMQNGSKGSNEDMESDEAVKTAEAALDEERAINTLQNGNWFEGLQQSITLFMKNLCAKESMIAFNTALTTMLSDDSYIHSTQVLLGKEQWLFYKTQIDGHPIDDYRGVNHFSEEELQIIAQNLIDNRNYFQNELGIRLVYMGIPNKESVYKEYMPDTVYRIREKTRADQLADYIKDHTNLEYVYPKAELISAKEKAQVYYMTDTHWNHIGAFVGLQAAFQEMYGTYRQIDTVKFSPLVNDYAGDLAMSAGIQDKCKLDIVYELDQSSVDDLQKQKDTVMIVGDSFSGLLYMEAEAYYDTVIWKYTSDFTMDMIEQYHPDIILWECTERYIENFKNVSLKDR